ncbi:discoidin domain-containing protein [Flavobacterium sp. TMP13]|uniref:discoidin domain-containing protein n=1 Tax=Flavobacterium sp. TMP13 TaxID=3425950 RepID=UPI003D77DD26
MKKTHILYTTLLLLFGLYACEKDKIPYEELSDSKEGALVFTARARDGIQKLKTFSIEEEKYLEKDTLTFNAGFGALGLPSTTIDVTFSLDNKVLDSINAMREINGEKKYIPFPKDAYEVSNLNLSIPKGKEYSDFSTIIYDPKKFDTNSNYLIAFTITDASGYAINPEVKTIIFVVSEIIIPEPEPNFYDKNNWKVIAFSSEESEGEGSDGFAANIIDGKINTYWHSCWSTCSITQSNYPHTITVDMKTLNKVNGIEFTQRQSGSRGVKLIEIEVSDNNESWRTLGEFNLLNTTAPQLAEYKDVETYRYFRMIIKSGYDDSGAAFVALGEVSPYFLK